MPSDQLPFQSYFALGILVSAWLVDFFLTPPGGELGPLTFLLWPFGMLALLVINRSCRSFSLVIATILIAGTVIGVVSRMA